MSKPKTKSTKTTKSPKPSLVDQVAQAVKLLDSVAAMVSVSKSSLTQADRRKAIKMKTGGEKFVPVIAEMAKRFNVNIGTHPVNAMMEKLTQVQTLDPLLKRATLLTQQLSDASLSGSADVWDSATVLYGTLKRVSRRNGEVQTTLAPVKEFFGRHAIAASPSKGTTTAAPANSSASSPSTSVAIPTPATAQATEAAPVAAAPAPVAQHA
jgi:hypothetical protein